MPKNIKSLLKSISVIHRMGHMFIDNNMKSHDIGSGHFGYLLKVEAHEGMSQDELSCYLGHDKSTTTKALKKLECFGYIKRLQDKDDKRILRIHITKKGKEIVPIFKENLDIWKNIITKNITDEELEFLEKLLDKMMYNAIYFNNNKN